MRKEWGSGAILRPISRMVFAVLLAAGLFLAVPAAAFADSDDNIAGALSLAAGQTGSLDLGDQTDVFYIDLEEGDTLNVSLTGAAGTDFDVFLYGPGSTDIYIDDPINGSVEFTYPDAFNHYVDFLEDGRYYLLIAQMDDGEGTYSLNWSLVRPTGMAVYRFYNLENGSHFYTGSKAERNIVIDRWPDVYDYEGISYRINTANPANSAPLYRFYNKVSGSHFYTASASERDMVIVRWSDIFTYEGVVYNVCSAPVAGATPMYRFYNRLVGSHFYTPSEVERQIVQDRWSDVYSLDGVAYWLAP